MYLVVGLGNPGLEYEGTRHNMGFEVLNYLMKEKVGEEINKAGFKGLYVKTYFGGQQVIFLKPMTYMNLSGTSVVEIVNYFKIPIENIIVIYDDFDLEPGKIRLRPSGSSGHHRGMQNIIDNLKTENIKRIRVGIGKADIGVIDYVLSKPKGDELFEIEKAIEKAGLAVEDILEHDFSHAMNYFNR